MSNLGIESEDGEKISEYGGLSLDILFVFSPQFLDLVLLGTSFVLPCSFYAR